MTTTQPAYKRILFKLSGKGSGDKVSHSVGAEAGAGFRKGNR
jgi:hypothetical protein